MRSHSDSVHSAEVQSRSAGGKVAPAVSLPGEALAAVAVAVAAAVAVAVAEHPTAVAERSAVVLAAAAALPAAAAVWSTDSVPMWERLEPA